MGVAVRELGLGESVLGLGVNERAVVRAFLRSDWMSESGTGVPPQASSGGSGSGQSGPGQAVEAMGSAAAGSNLPKIISFSSLVRCGDEVWIEHAGSLYRLRRTKQDKLILTK